MKIYLVEAHRGGTYYIVRAADTLKKAEEFVKTAQTEADYIYRLNSLGTDDQISEFDENCRSYLKERTEYSVVEIEKL